MHCFLRDTRELDNCFTFESVQLSSPASQVNLRASRKKQKVTLFYNILKIGNYDTTYQVFVENGNLVIAVGANMRKREWTPKKKSDGRVLSMLISVKISLQSLSSWTIFLERKDKFLRQTNYVTYVHIIIIISTHATEPF